MVKRLVATSLVVLSALSLGACDKTSTAAPLSDTDHAFAVMVHKHLPKTATVSDADLVHRGESVCKAWDQSLAPATVKQVSEDVHTGLGTNANDTKWFLLNATNYYCKSHLKAYSAAASKVK